MHSYRKLDAFLSDLYGHLQWRAEVLSASKGRGRELRAGTYGHGFVTQETCSQATAKRNILIVECQL